jgi:hypothetical protein
MGFACYLLSLFFDPGYETSTFPLNVGNTKVEVHSFKFENRFQDAAHVLGHVTSWERGSMTWEAVSGTFGNDIPGVSWNSKVH